MVETESAARGKKQAKFVTLQNFLKSANSESELKKVSPNQLGIDVFMPRCPRCGGQNVVKYEERARILKRNVQRYRCKTCGYKFIEEPNARSHFPM